MNNRLIEWLSSLRRKPFDFLMKYPFLLRLFRFGVVGGLGTFLNTVIYFACTIWLHIDSNISALCAFFIAIGQNYVLNHHWTFALENKQVPLSIMRYLRYVYANLGGLVCNLIALNLVIYFLGKNYHMWGQASGILVGMVFNFILVNKFVFNKKKPSMPTSHFLQHEDALARISNSVKSVSGLMMLGEP